MIKILSGRLFLRPINIVRCKTTKAKESLGKFSCGGDGGKIRDARGGSMGEDAAAGVEEYFHKKNIEQLEELQCKMKKQLNTQKAAMEQIQEQIEVQRKVLENLKKYLKEY